MLSLAWNLPHQLTKHFWKLFPVLHDLRGCFLICENGHYFYSCVSIRSILSNSLQGHSQTHGVSLHAWSEQCLPGTLQGNGCSEDLSYSPCRFSPVLISWTLPYLFLGFQFHFLSLEYLCFAWVAPLYHSLEILCLSNQEQLLGSLFFFFSQLTDS